MEQDAVSFGKELPTFRKSLLKFLLFLRPEDRGNRPLLKCFQLTLHRIPEDKILVVMSKNCRDQGMNYKQADTLYPFKEETMCYTIRTQCLPHSKHSPLRL